MKDFIILASVIVFIILVMVLIVAYIVFCIMVKSKTPKDIIFVGRTYKMESSVKQEDTEANRMKELFEEVSVSSFDGLTLNAYQFVQTTVSHEWAICVHGYSGSPGNMVVYAKHFMQRGMNVLLPELRGHGKSESKYYGLSYLDGFDINCLVEWILKTDSDAHILLFGISMGGASVAMASEMKDIKQVKCIITDSAPSSMYRQMLRIYKGSFKLPKFPIIEFIEVAMYMFAGYKLSQATLIPNIEKMQKPWLVIHGKNDGFVKVEMAQEIYDAAIHEKEILIVDGADHVKVVHVAPDLHWKTVDSFMEKYI